MARIVGWQALLCLFLMLQLAATQDFRMLRRVDNSITTPTRSVSSPEPSSKHSVTGKTDEPKKTDGSRGPVTTKAPDVTSSTSAIQTTPTVTASSSSENSPFFNSTIPAGHLPIQPVITPGWGVAGVILILTGLVYTLVGIKNRWINCFFSTAFLTALGISVLIVYIMTIPVSTAIQGAYVVAVTLSGCALGAASLIFKELTEGLGCAFGGFCLSMWFLCLAPGGLLHDTLGRAIFISCFSVGAFGFYFSRYTRDWAMMILMSFGGATVVVLGIDCYSRAGLKEFWAYIWNLNDDLFPLGADTYPITRGIRVETAAIVIICLIGVVSQVKLWKVVREKRERKAASLAEGQRHLEEEEEIVGRNIEAQAARERIEWEKVYAGRVLIKSNGSTESHYSNGTDGGSNNKNRRDRNSESVHTGSKNDCIEMTDLSDSNVAQSRASELIHFEMAKGGKVTVRVAADEVIEATSDSEHGATNEEIPEPDATRQNDDESTSQNDEAGRRGNFQANPEARRSSRRNHVTAVPEVVPLPFKVPTEDDLKSIGDRSSVATFADDEPIAPEDLPRDSLVRRVSQSSVTLLRSLSQRKGKNASPETQPKGGESSEELVDLKFTAQDDARSSVAATVDYESSTDDLQSSILGSDGRKSIEITAELGEAEEAPESKQMDDAVTETNDGKIHDDTPQEQPQQDIVAEPTTGTNEKGPMPCGMNDGQDAKGATSEAEAEITAEDEKASVARDPESTAAASNAVETRRLEPTDKATSLSSATSNVASLTKDRLPESLSRVALSFRTNEWTKHLSNAETPEPEAILIEPYATENDVEEAPRYVDIEDLQKTATGDVIPPSPAQRSKAQLIQGPAVKPDSKGRKIRHSLSNVLVSAAESLDALSPGASPGSSPTEVTMQPGSATMRRTSSGFAPIVEEQDGLRGASVPYPAEAMQQDNFQLNSTPFKPMVPRVVSFSNPNTLLGQRESVLRSRSQGNLVSHLSEMPVDTRGSVGDADSVYNYPAYNRAISPDPDDLPLNRRREMLRQSSSMTILPPSNLPPSNFRLNRSSSGIEVAGNTQFNSHQPKRDSSVSLVARETRLANFRQSLAHDLQSTTPGVPPNMGRETPFASTATLLDDMNTQRTVLIEKREAERQKREMQKREKEWHDRMFDSRMRSGDLLEAHREVIRKMQSSARDA